MITTRLQGGLANQMFQIMAAYALSKKLETNCAFDFNGCHTPLQGHTSVKYKDNFFRNFEELKEMPSNMWVHSEPSFAYHEIPLDSGSNIMLNGFFQSDKYFKEYRYDILRLFDTFPMESKFGVGKFLNDVMAKSGCRHIVSVHVRRGDYITPPSKQEFHTNLGDSDYYTKAMALFTDVAFIFVSDDINWCKENFKGDNIFYSPFTNEIDDLYLMASCSYQIIANSSFSWWGAYLSNNERVITPKNWFGPKGPKETQDITPDNWEKI